MRKRIGALEAELADPALYEKDAAKAKRLAKERGELGSQLARNEEKWLEMSTQYEEATAE